MNNSYHIRIARHDDADSIVLVLQQSIRKICGQYYDDPEIIDQWCSNKTKENILDWMDNAKNRMIVLLHNEVISAVGLVSLETRKILLCYVSPGLVRNGYGTVLLKELESVSIENGVKQIYVQSTLNAGNFYLRNGYAVTEVKLERPISLIMSKKIV